MVSAQQRIKILQEKTGHIFIDQARLERALTHSSARPQSGSNYERLEFLGDRVLGLITTGTNAYRSISLSLYLGQLGPVAIPHAFG